MRSGISLALIATHMHYSKALQSRLIYHARRVNVFQSLPRSIAVFSARQDKYRSSVDDKGGKLDLAPPKGSRDFYPEDMKVQQWLLSEWREVSHIHGFSEYDAPVLENEALYIRKAGEEVTSQLYNFEDKGKRRLALRPEMTPSLARMIMARRQTLPLPMKWFSIPQCWRYERMTRGRRREHYQWNMDILGIASVEAEAELLGSIICFFDRVGLTSADVGIKINSRVVLGALLKRLGVPDENFAPVCVLVDKLEKVPLDSLRNEFHILGLTDEVLKKLKEILAATSIGDIRHALALPSDSSAGLIDSCDTNEIDKLCVDSLDELEKLFEYADAAGYGDWLVFDASVVRGLAYYTGIVFEAFDRSGIFRAIAGGGRYDRLLETYGADSCLPACGFGLGDAVITEILADKGLLPVSPLDSRLPAAADIVVCTLKVENLPAPEAVVMHSAAMRVAVAIRKNSSILNMRVDLVLENKKMRWIFKHAERAGARFICFVAPDEWTDEKVLLKDLVDGSQTVVPLQKLCEALARLSSCRS